MRSGVAAVARSHGASYIAFSMSIPAQSPAASSPREEKPPSSLLALDTTAGSLLHQLLRRNGLSGPGFVLPLPAIYAAAAAVTCLPLLVGAILSPLSLTVVTETLRLPFLLDWNVLFMFLVSFPSLVVLTVNDQHVLSSSLHSVEREGTLTISEADADALCIRWKRYFRIINCSGQLLGVFIGIVVAYFNYMTYVPASVGYWIGMEGNLLPVGFIYLYAIFLFYFLAPVFILRGIATSVLLRDIVARSRLRMLPLHPDKSGGLRPVGRLGLRNQYLLTIFGLNVVILIIISFNYLVVPDTLYGLIAAAIAAYLIIGPIIFMAPMLSFRAGMLRTKTELLAEVALRLRAELHRMRVQLNSGVITKEDEELIDRLRKIGNVIDELPVWPFDAATLRKFIAAYIIPAIGSIFFSFAKAGFELVKGQLL